MTAFSRTFTAACCGMALILFVGCSDSGKTPKNTSGTPTPKEEGPGAHDHPTKGPHGGSLIELGKEEFHAELLHDELGGTVTIYVLDSKAKTAVPISATEVVINLKHDGKGEQFKLAASPQESDEKGKSSRFVSKDKELVEDLDHAGAEPRLVIDVNGKSFTGEVHHEHSGKEHSEKEHSHGKKEKS